MFGRIAGKGLIKVWALTALAAALPFAALNGGSGGAAAAATRIVSIAPASSRDALLRYYRGPRIIHVPQDSAGAATAPAGEAPPAAKSPPRDSLTPRDPTPPSDPK